MAFSRTALDESRKISPESIVESTKGVASQAYETAKEKMGAAADYVKEKTSQAKEKLQRAAGMEGDGGNSSGSGSGVVVGREGGGVISDAGDEPQHAPAGSPPKAKL